MGLEMIHMLVKSMRASKRRLMTDDAEKWSEQYIALMKNRGPGTRLAPSDSALSFTLNIEKSLYC